MASGNKKISDLIAAGSATNSDLFEIEQAGVSKKLTAAQLSTLLVGGKTSLVWYDDTVDNLMGGTALDTNIDKDLFSQYLSDTSGDIVIAMVKVTAVATQAGDEGGGHYSSEKIYTIRKEPTGQLSIKGTTTPYQLGSEEDLDHNLSIHEDFDTRLTIVTPASSTYNWNIVAEITYSSIYYEI